MAPKRIQRRRTKGWRMPEGTVYVGRPGRWGNVLKAGDCSDCSWGPHDGEHRPMTASDAVEGYRIRLTGVSGIHFDLFEDLRGHDLACWCPLNLPCHADVLLELANRPTPNGG